MKYILFILGLLATYFEPILGLVYLVGILFVVDFITGIIKTFKKGEKIKSKRLRWSFGKLFVYLGSMSFTYYCCVAMGLAPETAISVVKLEVWFIVYIEGLSVVENLLIIRSGDKFLLFLHYLLSVEFLKYIPVLSNFLKEKEDEDK
jgi:hypothetical protein